MSITPNFTDNSDEYMKRLRRGQKNGLIAAAQVLINAVKRAMAGGYTSGAFVQGNVINSVTKSEVQEDGEEMSIQVGSNVDYAVYWELGHHNIFTRRYERVEIWVPEAARNAEEMSAAFARQVKRALGAAA